MSKTVKLSKEELDTLKTNQDRIAQITFAIGQIEVQKSALLLELKGAQENQDGFGTQLFEKYGEGNISLETGELTLKEDDEQSE